MPNPYHDRLGRFTTSGRSASGGAGRGSEAIARTMRSRRGPRGSGGPPPADVADLSALRGRLGSAKGSDSSVEDLYRSVGLPMQLKKKSAREGMSSSELKSAKEYNASLARDRVEANKARNRAAGKKPLPKGFNANEMPIKVVDVPSTGTPRGRGKTHTQVLQEKMDRQAAADANLPKLTAENEPAWMKKSRAQAEAALKPFSNSSSNSAKLANAAKIYGKNSAEYKSARRTLFGKR